MISVLFGISKYKLWLTRRSKKIRKLMSRITTHGFRRIECGSMECGKKKKKMDRYWLVRDLCWQDDGTHDRGPTIARQMRVYGSVRIHHLNPSTLRKSLTKNQTAPSLLMLSISLCWGPRGRSSALDTANVITMMSNANWTQSNQCMLATGGGWEAKSRMATTDRASKYSFHKYIFFSDEARMDEGGKESTPYDLLI